MGDIERLSCPIAPQGPASFQPWDSQIAQLCHFGSSVPQKLYETINVHCFKLQSLGVISYIIDSEYTPLQMSLRELSRGRLACRSLPQSLFPGKSIPREKEKAC